MKPKVRFILVLFGLTLFQFCAISQFSFNFESGANFRTSKEFQSIAWKSNYPKAGYYFGLGVELKISNCWSMNGTALQIIEGYFEQNSIIGNTKSNSIRLMGRLEYKISKNFRFFAGPEYGRKISQEIKVSPNFYKKNQLRDRNEFLFNVGAIIIIDKLAFSFRYGRGNSGSRTFIADVLRPEAILTSNRLEYFQLGLAYRFDPLAMSFAFSKRN